MGSPGRTQPNHYHRPMHVNPHQYTPMSRLATPSVGSLLTPERAGVRRSSAAGIMQRPPLPPAIGTRSHSLDGLLDAAAPGNISDAKNVTEGASDANKLPPIHGSDDDTIDVGVQERANTSNIPKSHRRSRSMEDLIDEREEKCSTQQPGCEDRSRSMEHLAEDEPTMIVQAINCTVTDRLPFKDATSIGSASSLNPSSIEQPCGSETIVIDNTITLSECQLPPVSGTALRSSLDSADEDSISRTPSSYSRQDSTTSSKDSEKKKTFLNRYVKKVKSFIKK